MTIPFGYYYTSDVRYGMHDVGFTTLFRPGLYKSEDGPDPSAVRIYRQVLADVPADKQLMLGLELGHSRSIAPRKLIRVAKPYWDRVLGLDLADEPNWTGKEMAKNIERVRSLMRDEAGEDRPLGVTLTRDQVLHETYRRHMEDGLLDFVGLECYLDPPGPNSPQAAKQKLRRVVHEQADSIPLRTALVLIAQAYTRNGAWRPDLVGRNTLTAMQKETFRLAYVDLPGRVIAIEAFAYARPSGALDNPYLKDVHKQLVRKWSG